MPVLLTSGARREASFSTLRPTVLVFASRAMARHASNIRTKIGVDTSEDVYCVYHDYEDGFMDPYRMTIGYRASLTDAPEGLHIAEVPRQSVVTYEVKGPQPQSLISQWQAIWNGDLNRSYLADYDVYDATEPEVINVRVGVQS